MAKRRTPRYQRDAAAGEATERPPAGRIQADLTKQAPHNSYGGVPLFYEDMPFSCVDCGKEDVWTAKQQQWWYEVAKGPIYSHAVRCRACRAKRRAGLPTRPRPIGHIGDLIKAVRAEIEPGLAAAGFMFESRSKTRPRGERVWVDYSRAGQIFSFAYEQHVARLTAELLNDDGSCQVVAVAEIPQPPTAAKVLATIAEFTAAVKEFMTRLS